MYCVMRDARLAIQFFIFHFLIAENVSHQLHTHLPFKLIFETT